MLALVVDNTNNIEQRKLYLLNQLKRSGIYLTDEEIRMLCKYENELASIEAGEQRMKRLGAA